MEVDHSQNSYMHTQAEKRERRETRLATENPRLWVESRQMSLKNSHTKVTTCRNVLEENYIYIYYICIFLDTYFAHLKQVCASEKHL